MLWPYKSQGSDEKNSSSHVLRFTSLLNDSPLKLLEIDRERWLSEMAKLEEYDGC